MATSKEGCAPDPSKDAQIVAAQKRLPLTLVLPTYLPKGYALDGVTVDDQPPSGNRVSVRLSFKSAGGQFMIEESNYQTNIGGSVETVKVKNIEAQYQELIRPQSTVRSIAFQASDKVSVSLTTISLPRDEILAIASSMVK